MNFLIALLIFAASMTASLIADITMIPALAIGYVCFFLAAVHRGAGPRRLLRVSLIGMKESLIVVLVLAIIGMLTASWRAGGTILFFVYYGIRIIEPRLFLLIAFLLTCLLSYAIGTSFGVSATLGVIFMALARSGGVNELIAAGTILSGVYFGDRCSPASSSMVLTAAVTGTKPADNVKLMLRTAWLPTLLCLVIYAILSAMNPIKTVDPTVMKAITTEYTINGWLVIPALFMLILPLLRVNVKIAMGLSILSAGAMSLIFQHLSLLSFLRCCLLGYHSRSGALGTMLDGGGLISMAEIAVILLISCTYSQIFEASGMLTDIQEKLKKQMTVRGRFPVSALWGTVFCMVFCNQTIATIMAGAVFDKPYKEMGAEPSELAMDIENSLIVTAGLVPWAIACTVPLGFLGVGPGALPFACLLYLIPLCYLFTKKRSKVFAGY